MKPESLTMLQSLYSATKLPMMINDYAGNIIAGFPDILIGLYKEEKMEDPPDTLSKSSHPDGVTIIEIGEFTVVAVCKLNEDCYVSTIPIGISSHSQIMIANIADDIKPEKLAIIMRLIHTCPVMEVEQIASILGIAKYICEGVYAEGINYYAKRGKEVDITPAELKLSSDIQSQKEEYSHFEDGWIHRICNVVKKGDIHSISEVYREPRNLTVNIYSDNKETNRVDHAIIVLSSACEAAQSVCDEKEELIRLRNIYIRRIEHMRDVFTIGKLEKECLVEICKEVNRQQKFSLYSPYTKSILAYIHQNLYEPIRIQDIVEETGISSVTLTKAFKQDMHSTIHSYIESEKIEEAKRLLKETKTEISVIAEALAFSDQSHFTLKFRKLTGMTPDQYRKNKHRECKVI